MAITPEMLQQLIAQFQGQGLGDPTGILPASGIPQPVPLSGLPLGASGLGSPGETLLAGLGGGMGGGPMGQIPTPPAAPMMGPIGAGALGQGGYGGFGGGFQQGPATGAQEVPGAGATTSGDVLGAMQQGLGTGKQALDLYKLYQKFFPGLGTELAGTQFGQSLQGLAPFTGSFEGPSTITGTLSPEALNALTGTQPTTLGDFAGQFAAQNADLLGGAGGALGAGAGITSLAPLSSLTTPAALTGTSAATGFAPFTSEFAASQLGAGAAAGTGTAAGAGAAAGAAGAEAGMGLGTGAALGVAALPFAISDLIAGGYGGGIVNELMGQPGYQQAQKQANERQNAQMVQGRFLQDVMGAQDLNTLSNILENAQLGRYEGTSMGSAGGWLGGGHAGSPSPVVISNMVRGLAPEQMALPPEIVRAFDPGVGTWASLGHPNMDRTVTSPRTFFETILQDPSRFNIAMQSGTDVGGINDMLRQAVLSQIFGLQGTLPGTSPVIPTEIAGGTPTWSRYQDDPRARALLSQGLTPQQAMAQAEQEQLVPSLLDLMQQGGGI